MWGLSGHPVEGLHSIREGTPSKIPDQGGHCFPSSPAGYATRQCWWHGSSCQRSCSTCQSWSWSQSGWGRDWYFGGGRRSGRVLDDFGACWIYSKHIKIHQRQQLVKPEVSSFRFMAQIQDSPAETALRRTMAYLQCWFHQARPTAGTIISSHRSFSAKVPPF